MRLIVTLISLVVLASPARAQLSNMSGGESSSVWACFYECKAGPDVQNEGTFSEVTSLMLTNQGRQTENVRLYYLDGNQNFIGQSDVSLSTLDLDEVNICHTLLETGRNPPSAGLVEIISLNPPTVPSGIKAWVKNIGGKFFHSNPEIFEGRVVGIGKTKCEPVPVPGINDTDTIQSAGNSSPRLTAILIEDTDDPAQLPDLLPIPGAAPPFSYCRLTANGLQVEVRNQGAGASGATTTSVDFIAHGLAAQSTPVLVSGGVAFHDFPIPLGCFDSDCDFRIIVDSAGIETESNETNNVANDLCLG